MKRSQAAAGALFAVFGVVVCAQPGFSFDRIPIGDQPPPPHAPPPPPAPPPNHKPPAPPDGRNPPAPPDPSGPGGGGGGGGGSGGGGTGGGGATLASLTSAGDTSSGVSTASVSQSIADAAQQAVQARESARAEADCADGRDRGLSGSQNDKKCQHPARRQPQQAQGRVMQAQGRVIKAPVVAPAPAPVTYGSWVYGFGDYEVHQNVAPNSGTDVTRRTATGGTLGGFDVTFHGMGTGADRLMLGFMAGYSSARLTFPGDVLNTRMKMSGTSVGGYVKYFSGPFSNDSIFRADLFDLSQDQSFFGAESSTRMNVYTIADNFNYRFSAGGAAWWEPTAGVQYASTQYGSNAADLLLANGSDWRVQGGLRTGTSFPWNNALVTTTVTGLAYSDVIISGFVINNGLTPTSVPEDQGKLRGQGILTANLDFLNGVSIFAQGDVRGGKDLLAGGGRLGMRVGW